MIIIYFIQIRHTDDFPSTGTRLVCIIIIIIIISIYKAPCLRVIKSAQRRYTKVHSIPE